MKRSEQEVSAYPLAWPALRPRAKCRERAKFSKEKWESIRRIDGSTYARKSKEKLTIAGGRDRAIDELQRFGASDVVISTNLRLRQDGLPAGGQSEPTDPGVAVYFKLNKQPRVIACDKWDRVADNLAAIGKTIEAQRAMLRHVAVTADQIFAGFKALPGGDPLVTPAMTVDAAADFLRTITNIDGSKIINNADHFKDAYRYAVGVFHPDRNGGQQHPQWNTLQVAAGVLNEHHGIR